MKKEKKTKQKRSAYRKIVNGFIFTVMGIIFLLVVVFGFSQTSTFRNILKDEIVSIVESGTNGKLEIDRIDGTLLTSLFILDAKFYSERDTLVKVKKIELKISPLHLLVKKIYVRKIELENLSFRLYNYEDGTNNLSYLLTKPDTALVEKTEEIVPDSAANADTSTVEDGGFPFVIQVGNFNIKNADFRVRNYADRNKYTEYVGLETDDLWFKNLNLSLKAAADLKNKDIFVNLVDMSAKPNIKGFELKKLGGKFKITDEYASAEFLQLQTDSTDVVIDVRLDGFNLFGDIDLEQFEHYPINGIIDARQFYFGDLSRFVEATNILKGDPALYLKVDGEFGDIKIHELDLEYRNTRIDISGNLRKLHVPHLLELDVEIIDSYADYADVQYLMPGLNLPDFPGAKFDRLDLWMKGEPTIFKAGIQGIMPQGKINTDVYLDVKNEKMNYGITFNTEDFNVEPFAGVPSRLNIKGQGIGEGVNPEELIAQFNVEAFDSEFDFVNIDTLNFRAISDDKRIKVNIESELLSFYSRISGFFDYKNPKPIYDFDGKFTNLNMFRITEDSLFTSDLNFTFAAEGEGLAIDSITGKYNISLNNSMFNNKIIEDAKVDLELIQDNEGRAINLVSDFLDFNLNGKFSLDTAISLITFQSEIVGDIIGEKMSVFNPVRTSEAIPLFLLYDEIPEITKSELEFSFDYKFKDISLFATILGEEILDIAGNGKGELKNNETNFTISNNLYLDYFIRRNGNEIIYLSDVDADLNFSRDNQVLAFDNLFGSLAITGERIHAGSDINDVKGDITFNERNMIFDFSAEMEDYLKGEISGILSMSSLKQELEIGDLMIDYKGNVWQNVDDPIIVFTPELYTVEDLTLKNGETSFGFSGALDLDGIQDYKILLSDFTGNDLNRHMGSEEGSLPDGLINLASTIKGTIQKPEINLSVEWSDVNYGGINFGSLFGQFDYENLSLNNNFSFIGVNKNEGKKLLNLVGTLPIDLGFVGVENRFPDSTDIDLKFETEEFDLSVFGNTLPFVKRQSGLLTASLDVAGTYDSLIYSGKVNVENGLIYARKNDLDYDFDVTCEFNQDRVDVPEFRVRNGNRVDTDNKGEMIIKGGVNTNNLSLQTADINVAGDLVVLSSASRVVSPFMFGEVFIGTDGDWQLIYQEGRPLFKGKVLLKDVNLTYQPEAGKYSSTSDYNYTFVIDSSKIDKQKIKFEKIAAISDSADQQRLFDANDTNFDFEIEVATSNQASVKIPLSNASNQKLVADVIGGMTYSSIDGEESAQGVFTLLSGSNLEFFKVLEAEGALKFEGDVKNPYLDITATYESEYVNPPNYPGQTLDVAVKIKIEGTVDELGKNLATNPDNIKVLVGSRNIQNNIADESYDASDALSYIIIGRFKEDLTPDDKSRVASQPEIFESTATSFLGSVLTGFVNSAVGDYVNNIQLSQTSQYTKFSVSGRYQKFRYKVGGTTEVFENIEKANLRLAYLFSNNFLVRLERKDPVVQNIGLEEKVNELGLQYRFEF